MINVVKSNWSLEVFDIEKIREVYKKVCHWHNVRCPFDKLEENLTKYVVDEMTTSDINKMVIKSAVDLISVQNTNWQYIAWRFAMLNIYKEASRETWFDVDKLYTPEYFSFLLGKYINKWLYYNFYEKYSDKDIAELWAYIDSSRDMDYNHTTVLMYRRRYLLNPNNKIMELPQHMYMAIAMYLALPEKDEDRIEFVKKIYDSCSKAEISLPTPTLLNARTNFHQLSSCFKFALDDDLRGIYHWIENMAQVSKFWWGIWVYLGNIRSKWGTIRGNKWASWGVTPWAKVINDTAIAVNQLWARAWAISVTLDVFHRDIFNFLDLQTETGDIRGKAFDLFPSISIPDLFMERVRDDMHWTLFCPKEVLDVTWERLQDKYGDEFNSFYHRLEQDERLELKKTIQAKDLFKTYLKCTVETGMPYAFFRDTINEVNPNKHAWMVYNTNLCTEICQNISAPKFIAEELWDWEINIRYKTWDAVTCNLASLNVAKVYTKEKMNEVIPTVMRLLDNVITLNMFPVKETEETALKYRPVWLGYLGFAQRLAEQWLAYDSIEARDYADWLFKDYAYTVLRSSVDLAKERWHYPLFDWSEWSKWIFNWRRLGDFSKDNLDGWDILEKDMIEYWTRFWYHFAPAPNTSTAWVVGTTAGLVPLYKKYFVETNSVAPSVNVAPNLNEDNFWYYKEYVNLDMNDVIDMIATIYPYVDQSISFEWMLNIWKVSPKELYEYYFRAWEKKIKTVYYVRSTTVQPWDDCSSCSW